MFLSPTLEILLIFPPPIFTTKPNKNIDNSKRKKKFNAMLTRIWYLVAVYFVLVAFGLCSISEAAVTQLPSNDQNANPTDESPFGFELEDELKQLPTDSTNQKEIPLQTVDDFTGHSNSTAAHPVGGHQPKVDFQSEEETDDSAENDDDNDDDEDDDDNDNDEPVETPLHSGENDDEDVSVRNWDQMDAMEQDELYESKMEEGSDKEVEPPTLNGNTKSVLDEELELEKRMNRATAKFLSTGHLDETSVEDLVEMLIRFAGDPDQWERIRQILEKIRYEQITKNKTKARLRALAILNQPHINFNISKDFTARNEIDNGVLPKQNLKLKPKFNHKNNHVKQHSKMNKTKNHKLKQKQLQKNKEEKQKQMKTETEPYKYAVEKPVAIVGERSKLKQIVDGNQQPISQSLKAIQLEKSRILSSSANDDMEDQLKTLVKMEHRLKDHFQRKQKLLEQIRDSNNARMPKHN
ncbi:hypothetical protein CHUAL_004383 [Chamberlinius hualienensis]